MSWAKVFELWKELTGEDLLSKDGQGHQGKGKLK
jgi:hypothetical protein